LRIAKKKRKNVQNLWSKTIPRLPGDRGRFRRIKTYTDDETDPYVGEGKIVLNYLGEGEWIRFPENLERRGQAPSKEDDELPWETTVVKSSSSTTTSVPTSTRLALLDASSQGLKFKTGKPC